jgi:hypothetical protein
MRTGTQALRRRLVKGKTLDNRCLPETVARWPSC